MIESTDS